MGPPHQSRYSTPDRKTSRRGSTFQRKRRHSTRVLVVPRRRHDAHRTSKATGAIAPQDQTTYKPAKETVDGNADDNAGERFGETTGVTAMAESPTAQPATKVTSKHPAEGAFVKKARASLAAAAAALAAEAKLDNPTHAAADQSSDIVDTALVDAISRAIAQQLRLLSVAEPSRRVSQAFRFSDEASADTHVKMSESTSQRRTLNRFSRDLERYARLTMAAGRQPSFTPTVRSEATVRTVSALMPYRNEFRAAGLAVTSNDQRRRKPLQAPRHTSQRPSRPPPDDFADLPQLSQVDGKHDLRHMDRRKSALAAAKARLFPCLQNSQNRTDRAGPNLIAGEVTERSTADVGHLETQPDEPQSGDLSNFLNRLPLRTGPQSGSIEYRSLKEPPKHEYAAYSFHPRSQATKPVGIRRRSAVLPRVGVHALGPSAHGMFRDPIYDTKLPNSMHRQRDLASSPFVKPAHSNKRMPPGLHRPIAVQTLPTTRCIQQQGLKDSTGRAARTMAPSPGEIALFPVPPARKNGLEETNAEIVPSKSQHLPRLRKVPAIRRDPNSMPDLRLVYGHYPNPEPATGPLDAILHTNAQASRTDVGSRKRASTSARRGQATERAAQKGRSISNMTERPKIPARTSSIKGSLRLRSIQQSYDGRNDREILRGLSLAVSAVCDEALDDVVHAATGTRMRKFLAELASLEHDKDDAKKDFRDQWIRKRRRDMKDLKKEVRRSREMSNRFSMVASGQQ